VILGRLLPRGGEVDPPPKVRRRLTADVLAAHRLDIARGRCEQGDDDLGVGCPHEPAERGTLVADLVRPVAHPLGALRPLLVLRSDAANRAELRIGDLAIGDHRQDHLVGRVVGILRPGADLAHRYQDLGGVVRDVRLDGRLVGGDVDGTAVRDLEVAVGSDQVGRGHLERERPGLGHLVGQSPHGPDVERARAGTAPAAAVVAARGERSHQRQRGDGRYPRSNPPHAGVTSSSPRRHRHAHGERPYGRRC
jgi:hypothetical protein